MFESNSPRIGYVVKRYPRYSETFIVNEILAHERAGLDLEIFSLRPPCDTHFQASISQVRAPVTYLDEAVKMADLWTAVGRIASKRPEVGLLLAQFDREDPRDVYQALQLTRMIRDRGITHLHAHFATSATSVARMAALMAGVPYTFTAHAKDIFHESVDRDDLTRKLRDAAGVVTVSEFNLRFLRQHYGAHADRVTRIYNGLDLDAFAFSDPADRKPIIAAVGRLVEKKGFEDLIDACDLLAAEGLDFECHIAGGGELEHALRERIATKRLGSFVKMLGPLPMPEVIRLMRSASVFAAPCVVGRDGNRDGLPTV
ncbi:MAG: glycosyltransferase, partial [Rhodothermales bacterium]